MNRLTRKLSALLLAFALLLPNPAFALREEQTETQSGLEEIKLALLEQDPIRSTALVLKDRLADALGLSAPVTPPVLSAAGVEEDQAEPTDAAGWIERGFSLSVRNDPAALKAYQRALLLDNKNIDAWVGLGQAYYSQEDFPNAEKAHRKVIELAPNKVTGWMLLGFLLKSQKNLVGAVEAFQKASKVDPSDYGAWIHLGNAFFEQSSFQEAEAAYRKAIEVGPHPFAARMNLVELLQAQNKDGEAFGEYLLLGAEKDNSNLQRILGQSADLQETLARQGWVALDTERKAALDIPAEATAFIVSDDAPISTDGHRIYADDRLTHPDRQYLIWTPSGTGAPEVVQRARRSGAKQGDLLLIPPDAGITIGQVEALLRGVGYALNLSDAPRVVISDQAQVEATALSTLWFLASHAELPRVVILNVGIELTDQARNSYTLLLMT